MDNQSLKQRFEAYKKKLPIFNKAKELIDKYGQFANIPAIELKNIPKGFDESDLIACCMLCEERKKKSIIH